MPSPAALPLGLLPVQVHISAPPNPALEVCVVVPVRDEEETLPAALDALARQTTLQGKPLDLRCCEVLILANNCRDHSAALARHFAQSRSCLTLHVVETTLPPQWANIGAARRLVMDEACRRLLRLGKAHGVIASTDGDAEVGQNWLAQTLREFGRGADAVGGRIRIKAASGDDPDARRYAWRNAVYQRGLVRLESLIDPDPADLWPRHHQFFGGSLAVTADAYCRVGGLPIIPCLEDMALERALMRQDMRVRHSPSVRVQASARQAGRVDLGMASQLRTWGEMGRAQTPHCVQQPQAVETRLRARALLRQWRHSAARGQMPCEEQVDWLAEQLAVPCGLLHKGLAQPHHPFGETWEQVLEYHAAPGGEWARRWPLWEITQALPDLRVRLANYQRVMAG